MIVQRKLPRGVDMPVQKDALPDLSAARAERRDVYAFLLRKQRVNDLPVQNELEQE